ncbi:SPOR domain-containing protein [Alteromonas confluentis]|uniref:SPOR domain-containing protein n=1 Tax=Alteromonas confluentis TaxID=1656094 RepID=A0A1E7Z868_9ALTE|nr:SPOR domain-containing protein [Alteromonas confluentis]OFC69718.1 hypothetical protein BFC18_16765 [Alteromonas confluentis]
MQSELHERLEYLVNYSSQLIFVSGDSAAQQKKTLESFVFQQHDETEIAYVTADPIMELADYRRQLCRQLLGTLVGSYTRPLNELLAGLNEHVGPILITITQAEYIPDSLLQELWDLVLQSRFAGNKQHLNVLLFGESSWAERAKKWLPAKNTDTPLLISSQSVATQQPGSELDKMIENRRKAFHEHVAKRDGYDGYMETQSTSLLKKPLFITLMILLLLSIFIAIVYWQYRDDIDALFSPIDQNRPPYTTAVEPGSAFNELANEEAEEAQAADQPVVSWDDAVASIDNNDSAQPAESADTESEDLLSFIEDVSADPEARSGNVDGEDLATNTQNRATSTVPEEPMAASGFDNLITGTNSSTSNGTSTSTSGSGESREQFTASQIEELPLSRRNSESRAAVAAALSGQTDSYREPVVEAPVEEVLAEEPVVEASTPAELAEAEPSPEEATIETPAITPSQPKPVQVAKTEPAQPTVTQPSVTRTQEETPSEPTREVIQSRDSSLKSIAASSPNYDNWELVNNINPDDYIIQLAGLKDEALMQEFIEDNSMESFIWIYRTNRYGGNWFVVLFNDRFSTFSEANAAIKSIPAFQGSEKIFIKRGRNVIEEIEKVFP